MSSGDKHKETETTIDRLTIKTVTPAALRVLSEEGIDFSNNQLLAQGLMVLAQDKSKLKKVWNVCFEDHFSVYNDQFDLSILSRGIGDFLGQYLTVTGS